MSSPPLMAFPPFYYIYTCKHSHICGNHQILSGADDPRGKEMATSLGSILVAMYFMMGFLLGSVSAMEERDKEMKKVIHVGGEVHCQDCSKDWNHWTKGSTPIKGARVSVSCMDERQRVVYYGSDESDESGQFNVIFGKYVHGKPVTDRLCKVRLVSSPDQACNVPTDFAGGRSGVKLEHPTFVYREITKYTVGPLYYTSPMCEEPEI